MRRRGRVQKHGPTWRYQVDVHAEGEPRRREWRGGFRTKADAQAALNDRLRDDPPGRCRRPDRTRPSANGSTTGSSVGSWPASGQRPSTPTGGTSPATCIPVIGDRRLQAVRSKHVNALYRGMLHGVDGRQTGRGSHHPLHPHGGPHRTRGRSPGRTHRGQPDRRCHSPVDHSGSGAGDVGVDAGRAPHVPHRHERLRPLAAVVGRRVHRHASIANCVGSAGSTSISTLRPSRSVRRSPPSTMSQSPAT